MKTLRWTLFWIFVLVYFSYWAPSCFPGDPPPGVNKGPPGWAFWFFFLGLPLLAAIIRQFDEDR